MCKTSKSWDTRRQSRTKKCFCSFVVVLFWNANCRLTEANVQFQCLKCASCSAFSGASMVKVTCADFGLKCADFLQNVSQFGSELGQIEPLDVHMCRSRWAVMWPIKWDRFQPMPPPLLRCCPLHTGFFLLPSPPFPRGPIPHCAVAFLKQFILSLFPGPWPDTHLSVVPG